jgi:NDP-sugar pyrophosphorylase family protein
MKKAAILAAGEGSRLKSISHFKPLTNVNGTPLLELTLKNLHFHDFSSTHIIFNSEEKTMDFKKLPSLMQRHIHYFFKSTPSSMHSLHEVAKRLKMETGEHFFVSMVDSIVHPDDARNFLQFCAGLAPAESAILVTKYIEDEKPLTVKADSNGYVEAFQCPVDDETYITSGVYYFSSNILPTLDLMITSGQSKMRNFLSALIEKNYRIRIFEVEKTLDIDRPEDILSAAHFLKGMKNVED